MRSGHQLSLRTAALISTLLALGGCTVVNDFGAYRFDGGGASVFDAGPGDASINDLGRDAQVSDLGSDSGGMDSGVEAGLPDLGMDSGMLDLGTDAGAMDLGFDTGVADLSGMDLAVPDDGGVRCGDNVIGDGETCDDGNIASGDGCSERCQAERFIASEVTVTASDGSSGDRLGRAVGISADGARLLVGAYRDDTAFGAGSGSARVFLRSPAGWTEEATLTGSSGRAGDELGVSIAMSADGTRALVGSLESTFRGSARVFVRIGSVWSEEAVLRFVDGAPYDYVGWSVALTTDGSRALVGALFFDTSAGTNAGTARVFVRTGTSWTEEARFTPSDGAAGDEFGRSVALSADGSRAVIGATGDDTAGGTNTGSAQIFVRTGSTWTREALLTHVDSAADDSLGHVVAMNASGDRVFATALTDDVGGVTDAGSVRVFTRSGALWTEEAPIFDDAPTLNGRFGTSIATNTSGTRLFASSPFADTDRAIDTGSAFVFERTSASWVILEFISPADVVSIDGFGTSAVLSADGRVGVVGLPGAAGPGGSEVGSVRVYDFTR